MSWIGTTLVSWLAAFSTLTVHFQSYCGPVLKPEPRREPWNIKYAKELAREVREADASGGLELIFYGDSITEQWRGTDQGGVCTRCTGDSAIFDQYFGSKYRSGVFAVGGDQIGHLLWRLEHGDLPELHQPKVVVVMIGINDLGAAADCSQGVTDVITKAADGVNDRLEQTITLLRDSLPDAHVVLLALLPRGDGRTPDRTYEWPSRYSPAIKKINSWLEDAASKDDAITYLDCGPKLLKGGKIVPENQVDGLHPSPAGMLIMANCISPVVDSLIGSQQGQQPSTMMSWLHNILHGKAHDTA